MNIFDSPRIFFLVLFLGFLLVEELGHRLEFMGSTGDSEKHRQIEETRNQIAVLLSLLLGFTLSMAMTRYDYRKQLVVEEANSIGTTFLRAQMLSEPVRGQSIALLKQYVDARMAWVQAGESLKELDSAIAAEQNLHDRLWQLVVPLAQQAPTPIVSIYVQTLNDMIDLQEKRVVAHRNRVPDSIWAMLILLGAITCFTFGLSQRRRVLVSMIVPPLMVATVLALVADIDSPRGGFIQVSQGSMLRLQQNLQAVSPSVKAHPQPGEQ
jgi:hypothetical protein